MQCESPGVVVEEVGEQLDHCNEDQAEEVVEADDFDDGDDQALEADNHHHHHRPLLDD